MSPFDAFPKSKFEIISPEGQVRNEGQGIFTGKMIAVFDEMLHVFAGDEIRRRLPNGTDETFEVVDPVFYEQAHTIPAHFQIKVRRKGAFPHGQGGNYNINVHGQNSRVNIGSVDNSFNVATHHQSPVFADLVEAIRGGVRDEHEREALIARVREMETAPSGEGFRAAYQAFIQSAANHMTVIAPILPALTSLL